MAVSEVTADERAAFTEFAERIFRAHPGLKMLHHSAWTLGDEVAPGCARLECLVYGKEWGIEMSRRGLKRIPLMDTAAEIERNFRREMEKPLD